ncbi:MAG: phosphopantothenoylcysteine decarboxylase, partial [Aquificaceae bacterium]|nr:phosphopantothenoylcysteine decarboxylase [Aquificaceae bacterium]
RLLDWVEYALRPKPLRGKKVLITAGATREFIDSVRFISNLSSGAMGFSLARVFRWYGAQVKVVAGFTTAEEPPEVEVLRVTSAQEMREKVMELKDWADIILMNAAVADYRPSTSFLGKLKKEESLSLELVKNPDILLELGQQKGNKVLIGFALEEEEYLIKRGEEKLIRKNLDALVANPLSVMGEESYRGVLLLRDGRTFPLQAEDKLKSAEALLLTLTKELLKDLLQVHLKPL